MLGSLLWMTCTPGTRLHLKQSQASHLVLPGLDSHTSVTHTLMRAPFWGDSSQSSCSKARRRSQHADKITTSRLLGSLLVTTLTPGIRLSLILVRQADWFGRTLTSHATVFHTLEDHKP